MIETLNKATDDMKSKGMSFSNITFDELPLSVVCSLDIE